MLNETSYCNVHIRLYHHIFFLSKQYSFRNASLPLEARVGDLLKQLTLEEKISWQQ
jgi:hypothetical protein